MEKSEIITLVNKSVNSLISNFNDKTIVNFITVRDLDNVRHNTKVPKSFNKAVNDLISNFNDKTTVNFTTVRDLDNYRQFLKVS